MKVTMQNYEEFALDYLDETLPEEEARVFERFLEEHPEIGREVRELRQTMPVLVPEPDIRCPDRESLKRKTSSRRLLFRITAVAAAALLVGVVVLSRLLPEPEGIDPTSPTLAGSPALTDNVTAESKARIVNEVLEKEAAATPESSTEITNKPRRNAPDGAGSVPAQGRETDGMLADAAPLPVRTPVKSPVESVARTVDAGSGGELAMDAALKVPVRNRPGTQVRPSAGSPEKSDGQGQVQEIREVISVTPEEERTLETVSESFPDFTPDEIRLASASDARMDLPADEPLWEYPDESPSSRSAWDYFSPNGGRTGFANVINQGVRRLASELLTPLSALSPVRVYENNEERVVEFASIPISRKSNKTQE